MILSLALLTAPVPPTPFPADLQGAWDGSEYSCSRPDSTTRMIIARSHFVENGINGYSVGFDRLSKRVVVVEVLGSRSNKTYQALRRYELSEDGNVLFVQSHTTNEKKPGANAQIFIRCPDQEKAMEQFK